MISTKLYTAIYVVLFVSATIQVLVELAGLSYRLAFGVIMVLSIARTVLVMAYFQRLRFEPRSLTYPACISLVAALAFALATSYSLL